MGDFKAIMNMMHNLVQIKCLRILKSSNITQRDMGSHTQIATIVEIVLFASQIKV